MYSKKPMEDDARKLTFVVVIMLLFVLMLFGLGPLI